MPIATTSALAPPARTRPTGLRRLLMHGGRPVCICLLALLAGCGAEGTKNPSDGGERLVMTPWTVPLTGPAGEPWLSTFRDTVVMSWLEEVPGGHAMRAATVVEGGVRRVATVVEADDLFVNWADVPSVQVTHDGRWVAHYLQRGGEGTYDYRVLVTTSGDQGRTWSPPSVPHTDATPTEHGFVSAMSHADGSTTLVWLDGRRFVDGAEGPATEEMALRARALASDGTWGEEGVVDALVCDCCQTGAAATREGWVVVYRDRTRGEVRDIHSARLHGGRWLPGGPVHPDGWIMPACPVNGPAVAARGDTVAVAWFSAAGDEPRVQLAFSRNGGATFEEPVRLDQGDPVGRVDVVVDAAGAAWALWMEGAGDGAELRLRRVTAAGGAGPWHSLVATERARSAGFPRLVEWPAGGLLLSWTEPGSQAPGGTPARVRLAHVALPTPPATTPAPDEVGDAR